MVDLYDQIEAEKDKMENSDKVKQLEIKLA